MNELGEKVETIGVIEETIRDLEAKARELRAGVLRALKVGGSIEGLRFKALKVRKEKHYVPGHTVKASVFLLVKKVNDKPRVLPC